MGILQGDDRDAIRIHRIGTLPCLRTICPSGSKTWEFPRIRGTFLGGPYIKG